ncbi:MAG: YciI family protein [Devosia sp.]
MRWIAIFEDQPDALAIGEANAEAHFDYLEKHREQIRLAGGVRDEPGGAPDGGLWIMDHIASRADAVRLCEEDPFFTAGLRARYVLKAWGFAPCYADVVF